MCILVASSHWLPSKATSHRYTFLKPVLVLKVKDGIVLGMAYLEVIS